MIDYTLYITEQSDVCGVPAWLWPADVASVSPLMHCALRGVSHYCEKVSHYYDKLSNYYEKLSKYYEKLSHYNEKLSHYYDKLSHYYDTFSHYCEKFSQYNDILSHNYEKVSHYYDLNNYIFLKVAEKVFHIKMTNVCSHILLLNKSIDLFLFLLNLSPNIKMVVYHKFPQKNINQRNCF